MPYLIDAPRRVTVFVLAVAFGGVLAAASPVETSGQPTIYVTDADKGHIVAVSGDGAKKKVIVPGVQYVADLELDAADGRMYWTDINGGTVYRARTDGSEVEILWAGETNSFPAGIALDLQQGHVYWVNDDISTGRITRTNLDGTGLETFLDGLSNVNAIAVDPAAGHVYWSAQGAGNTAINRTNMDGSGTTELVLVDGGGIDDIAVDPAGGKMYMTVAGSNDRLVRANLDGSGLEDLTTSPDPQGITLDLPNGKVYWTDEDRQLFLRANLDGSTVEELGFTGVAGQGIDLDETTGKVYFGVSGTDFYIRRANSDGSQREDVLVGVGSPYAVATDIDGGWIYWTSSGFGPNALWRAPIDGSSQPERLKSSLRSPEGIALDLTAGKVYWTERFDGTIKRADLDGANEEELLEDLSRPTSLALDLGGGKMYWVESQSRTIHRAELDGSQSEQLLDGDNSFVPAAIALDLQNGKLYWANDSQGSAQIGRASLDGSGREDVVTDPGFSEPAGIALDIQRGKVYWSSDEIGNSKLLRANLDGSSIEEIIPNGLGDPGQLTIDTQNELVVGLDATAAYLGFQLHQNYPNPFSDETTLLFEIDEAANVTIEVFDLLGRRMGALVDALYAPGQHSVVFDAGPGGTYADGVYIVRMRVGDRNTSRLATRLRAR